MTRKQDLPIWVLNLRRDQERRRFMSEQMQQHGLDFDFFPAVDKRDLTERDLALYSPTAAILEFGRELCRGEIACALSHARIWQRIVSGGHAEALVLEDDVLPRIGLKAIIGNRNKLPDDYDFINFTTPVGQTPIGEPISGHYRAARHQYWAGSNGAYLLTLDGARKLLAHAFPIRFPSDNLTARVDITRLVSYGIHPGVVAHADGLPSRIWEKEELESWRPSILSVIGKLRWRFAGARRTVLRSWKR